MKHVFSVLSVTCIAFFTIFLSTTNTGCKKGDDGAKGDTGTANVMFSPWLDVQFEENTNAAGDTVYYYSGTIPAPKLTKAILDSGTVKVYLNYGSPADQLIFPLPITEFLSFTGISQLSMYFTVGNIEMYSDVDVSSRTVSGVKRLQYRYVLIPGGVPTGRSETVNWNDYEAVKKYTGMKD